MVKSLKVVATLPEDLSSSIPNMLMVVHKRL